MKSGPPPEPTDDGPSPQQPVTEGATVQNLEGGGRGAKGLPENQSQRAWQAGSRGVAANLPHPHTAQRVELWWVIKNGFVAKDLHRAAVVGAIGTILRGEEPAVGQIEAVRRVRAQGGEARS